MADVIKILPMELASKIAAGEVVQRPASVVKELMENSVDAGATSITTVLKNAGKTLIQVVDNGVGMSPSDARLAFERHATSKIGTYSDLENIRTLGFRGEALASIGAVAQVELRTKPSDGETGTSIRFEGGEQRGEQKIGMESGTSVAVKNLFYNTPARKNFLKSNSAEFKHIYESVQRAAIAHPEIGIRFVSDEETILDLRPSGVEERLTELFGARLVESLMPLKEDGELFKVSGFLGRPEFARRLPTEQFLFLNKRFITNRSLNHAVYSGYEHLIEKGSYPFALLFLDIDPRRVDVNVHPTKLEVKFEDERSVYRFIIITVRRTLGEHDLIPAVTIEEESNLGTGSRLKFTSVTSRKFSSSPIGGTQSPTGGKLNLGGLVEKTDHEGPPTGFSPSEGPNEIAAAVRPLTQIHNKYILLESASNIMLIDQHAAHERILYERVIPRLKSQPGRSQQLLFPQMLELSPADFTMVRELHLSLEKIGFQIKFFGKQTLVVEGVPPDVKPGHEASILREVIDEFNDEERNLKSDILDRLAKSFACRAAVKAGDRLSSQEMSALVSQLFATEVPYVCPHGRPVSIKLSNEELDRRFGRT